MHQLLPGPEIIRHFSTALWSCSIVLVLVALPGCNRSEGISTAQPKSSSRAREFDPITGEVAPRTPVSLEHDFGVVLARNQTLTHTFELTNNTKEPIRVEKTESVTPCCSSISKLPALIQPASSVNVATSLRVAFSNEPKRVEFLIYSNSSAFPIWKLALAVTPISEREFETDRGTWDSITPGKPEPLRCRITCRRNEREGIGPPTGVTATPPLEARFLGEPQARRRAGGVIESTRAVELRLADSLEPGVHRRDVSFSWDSGEVRTYTISWQVKHVLHLSPSAIVLKPTDIDTDREVVLRSDDAPFRVIGVRARGRELEFNSLDRERALEHRVRLKLGPPNAIGAKPADIEILTDHPIESSRIVTVFEIPSGRSE